MWQPLMDNSKDSGGDDDWGDDKDKNGWDNEDGDVEDDDWWDGKDKYGPDG